MSGDSMFTGSIPAIYEECLVPVLFAPYAADLVARVMALKPSNVLEIAAGTGAVTRLLAAALEQANGDACIVATDLNTAMIELAAAHLSQPNLTFKTADAQALPFSDACFDLVYAQFGAMFFPDKIGAYREAKRVLKPGGRWLFNVWDRLEANPGSEAIQNAVSGAVPEPKPDFMARMPFGYHDPVRIELELREAGFTDVSIERIGYASPPASAERLARGMCQGSPLANELAVHSEDLRKAALKAAKEAAKAIEPDTGFPMSALVITAR